MVRKNCTGGENDDGEKIIVGRQITIISIERKS
jgi:hypothetical protein